MLRGSQGSRRFSRPGGLMAMSDSKPAWKNPSVAIGALLLIVIVLMGSIWYEGRQLWTQIRDLDHQLHLAETNAATLSAQLVTLQHTMTHERDANDRAVIEHHHEVELLEHHVSDLEVQNANVEHKLSQAQTLLEQERAHQHLSVQDAEAQLDQCHADYKAMQAQHAAALAATLAAEHKAGQWKQLYDTEAQAHGDTTHRLQTATAVPAGQPVAPTVPQAMVAPVPPVPAPLSQARVPPVPPIPAPNTHAEPIHAAVPTNSPPPVAPSPPPSLIPPPPPIVRDARADEQQGRVSSHPRKRVAVPSPTAKEYVVEDNLAS
jgi:hypothetical protein